METATVGRVTTEAVIENLGDLWRADQSDLPADRVRRVAVTDALVDTQATFLSMPSRLIARLGLSRFDTRRERTGRGGPTESGLYAAVRLTIQGRSCSMDVFELPDTEPVLVGQLPLTHLDLVADPRERRLIGNPAHGGEHVYNL